MSQNSQALELRRNMLSYDQLYYQGLSDEKMADYYKKFFFDLKKQIQADYRSFGTCEYIESILQRNGSYSEAGSITNVEIGVLFILSLSLQDSISYAQELHLDRSDSFPYTFSGITYVDKQGNGVLLPDSFVWCFWRNGGSVMSSHSMPDLIRRCANSIKNHASRREQPAPAADPVRIPIDGPDTAPAASAAPAAQAAPVPPSQPTRPVPAQQPAPQEPSVQAQQKADELLRLARQSADQIRADALKEADAIRQKARQNAAEIRQNAAEETARAQNQLAQDRAAVAQAQAELQQRLAAADAEAGRRVEEAVRTQLIERRAQLRSQWNEEDAREAQKEAAVSAALDRSKEDLYDQINQLKISWRKDMDETIQRMQAAQQQLESSLRGTRDSLYLQEREPLAECYPQLYALLQGRSVTNLQTEFSREDPDPEVIRQNLNTLLKSLETYQRKLGKALNRVGMYEISPSTGAPYDDITQEPIDGQPPADPGRAVVAQCIRPGIYYQPEGRLDDSMTLVRALVRLKDTEV